MTVENEMTLVHHFYKWEKETPNNIYLRQPIKGSYRDFTWYEVSLQARKIASYLHSLFLPPKTPIAIVSKNCAEWIIADIAIMISGNISVPLFPTLSAPQLNYVLEHSESKVAFIGKLDDWESMKSGVPEGVQCISFPNYNPDGSHQYWNDILGIFKPMREYYYPKLDDIMSIIYTSGTTGNPKGVMITYRGFTDGIVATSKYTFIDRPNSRFFSYLPLSHIAERNVVEALSLVKGGTIYFIESLDSFAKNLKDAHPTYFMAVPRIWTKFQQGILSKMTQKKLDLLLKIPIVSSIVKSKIKKQLGLNDSWLNITGAAPMPSSLIQWFRKLDIIIQEAYGMTENLGAVCIMPIDHIKDGYVGKVYPNMEVKIAENTGEILTRATWNMVGYFKNEEMTKETLDADGWLHTGDVGELDSENYLKITGRIKELYKTSKGEYIAPSQIEMKFSQNQFIDQICLVGNMLPQPMALVTLTELADKLSKEELINHLKENLKNVNQELKSFEKVSKLIVLKEPWTVENNKLTPTLKIKRNVIEQEFDGKLTGWDALSDKIIFE